jgi:hypothetical protein
MMGGLFVRVVGIVGVVPNLIRAPPPHKAGRVVVAVEGRGGRGVVTSAGTSAFL